MAQLVGCDILSLLHRLECESQRIICGVVAVLKFKPGGGILTPDTVFFTMTRTDWRCVALWSGIVLAPNSLPAMVGYQMPGDIEVLTGTAHHTADTMSYLANMRLAYDEGICTPTN